MIYSSSRNTNGRTEVVPLLKDDLTSIQTVCCSSVKLFSLWVLDAWRIRFGPMPLAPTILRHK